MNTVTTTLSNSIARRLGLLAATATLLGLSALSTPALAGAYPEFYPQQIAAPSTVTRAEVKAELLAARRDGSLVDGDGHFEVLARVDTGLGMGKTRAQVRAETLEAIRLGLIPHGEQNIFPTVEQLEQVRLAGLRALPMNVAQR